MVQTSDGGYAIAGETTSFGAEGADFWLVKVSAPTPTYCLTVVSAHGSPTPSVGTHSYDSGSSVTCRVTSPDTEGGVTYMCTGWTGTGSVTSSCCSTSTTFSITQNFTITWNWIILPQKVATPVFSPSSGTYSTAQSVTISCSTGGATIRYTTDGSDPTPSSALYSGPIVVDTIITLKAKAFKTDMTDSDTATATYTINVIPEFPSFIVLLIFIMATTFAVIVSRRKRS